MGFGRCSCKFCVFGNQNQFATAACISRHKADLLIGFEKEFGVNLKRDTDLASLIAKGKAYASITPQLASQSTSFEYKAPIIVPEGHIWDLPAGAFTKCK